MYFRVDIEGCVFDIEATFDIGGFDIEATFNIGVGKVPDVSSGFSGWYVLWSVTVALACPSFRVDSEVPIARHIDKVQCTKSSLDLHGDIE
jgi:hypothetical protein